jgi:predicted Zn-dependent peptidase
MKKIFLFLFAGILLTFSLSAQLDRSQPPKPGPAPVVNIGDYNMFTLSNGLKVIVVENHKTPVISWQLSLDIDPVMEGDAKGYVDMAGQLMRSGTKNRTKQEIDEEIDFIGASLSTYSTGIYASSLTRHKDKLLDLMSDVLLNPVFPQDELEKMVEQSISALAANENDANFMVDNLITSVVYGEEHPYGEVVTKEKLENITRDHVANYYNTYFKPNTAYLVIVGDITTKEAKELTKKYFKNWEKGDVPKATYANPQAPAENTVAFANRDGAVQSVLAVSYPIEMQPGDPDAIKASVMNSVLGGGVFSGRLMQNLREDKAYTYGARSSLSSDKVVGRFTARTEVGNNVTDSALVEILYELDRMVNEPVDSESLELVKNFMNGSFARSLESPRTIANFALNIERYNLPKDYYKTYLERLAAVTTEDVTAMAKKYIKPENAWILVAGNKGEVSPKLARFSAANEVLFFDPYGRKVESSGAVIPEGMTAEKVVEGYIKAIGGADKLKSVTDQKMKMSTEMQGMTIEMESVQKAPDKVLITVSMGGNVMQKQVFDGERGMATAMGQKTELEGKQLDEMRLQAKMFPELDYANGEYQLELLEVEDLGGQPAYKLQVTNPSGTSVTEFYDVASSLKVRTITTQETQMGPMTVSASYDDYRDVEGVKIPFALKQQTGPQTMDMKVVSVELNSGVSDDVFKVE